MMPRQLQRGLLEKRYSRRTEQRFIAEQLPSISVNDLPIPSPYDYKTYTLPNISLRYPQLASVKIFFTSSNSIIRHRGETTGPIQTFRLKHIKTGFGVRHAFICTCQRPVIKLYYLHRKLACRRCCNAIYASQTLNQHSSPVLQASRIQSFLDNKPRLFRRTRERLKKKLGEKLKMAQGSLRTRARSLWR
jgi:hypothetical protein